VYDFAQKDKNMQLREQISFVLSPQTSRTHSTTQVGSIGSISSLHGNHSSQQIEQSQIHETSIAIVTNISVDQNDHFEEEKDQNIEEEKQQSENNYNFANNNNSSNNQNNSNNHISVGSFSLLSDTQFSVEKFKELQLVLTEYLKDDIHRDLDEFYFRHLFEHPLSSPSNCLILETDQLS